MEHDSSLTVTRRLISFSTIFTVSTVCLGFLIVSNSFIAEAGWFSMFLAYIPQGIYLIPWIGLLAGSLITRKPKRAVASLFGGSIVLFALMGLRIHFLSHPSDHLRVMTFNIEDGNQGIDKVIALIRHENADVFCLQECDSTPDRPVIAEITNGMPGYRIVAYGGMLIGSRLPVVSSRTIPFPTGPPLRPILEAIVEWQGERIRIADVHLIPVYIDRLLIEHPAALADHLRFVGRQHEQQIGLLLDYARNGTEPLILCGDFNSPATGVLYHRLSGALRDSFALAGTGFGFTIPASFPLVRMDYIYSTKGPDLSDSWVPGQVASDHRPVLAEFFKG